MSKGKAIPYIPQDYSQSVRVEPIENGYLTHHSIEGPDVKDGYQRKTFFHRSNPIGKHGRRAQLTRILGKFTKASKKH